MHFNFQLFTLNFELATSDSLGVTARAQLCAFSLLAVAVLSVSFAEAWTRGWVLSQADFFLASYPWAAYAHRGFLKPGNPLLSDVPAMFYPFLTYASEVVRSGGLPLWNPLMFAGQPFLAAAQPAVLSPFTAIAYVWTLPAATVPMAMAKLLVGGVGMFVLVRRLSIGMPGAVFAGLVYLLNAFSVVWLEHNNSGVAAWLPWILWATDRVVREGRARDVSLLAVFVGLDLVAGHPETVVKVALLAVAFGIATIVSTGGGAAPFVRMTGGWIAGAGLAAVQLLPFLEYLFESRAYAARSATAFNTSVAPLATAITALAPDFFGRPDGQTMLIVNRFGNGTNYCEQQVYAGVVTWVLAVVGVSAHWRDSRVRFFLGAVMLGFLLMYGAPGVPFLASRLPLFDISVLARFSLLSITGAIVLAAFGLETLSSRLQARTERPASREPDRFVVVAWVMACVITTACLLALAYYRTSLSELGVWRMAVTSCAIAIASAMAVGILTTLRARGLVTPLVVAAALIAIQVVDLTRFTRAFHPLMPAELVFPVVPELASVQHDPDVFRVAGWGGALLPNANVVYGLPQFRGYDALSQARYSALLDAALGSEARLHEPRPFQDSVVFDLLNVKYVFTMPGVDLPAEHYAMLDVGRAPLYRNLRVQPRAFLVDRYVVASRSEAPDRVTSGQLDLAREAVLETDLPPSEAPEPSSDLGTARIVEYSAHDVTIETNAPARRLLVLTDSYFPGWQATIDGDEVTIHPANAAFRAVSVPAGQHVVRFRYRPASFRFGVALTFATGALLLLIVGWETRLSRFGGTGL